VPALSEQLTGLQKCLSDMCTQQGQGQMIIESTLQLVCLTCHMLCWNSSYKEFYKTSNRHTKYF